MKNFNILGVDWKMRFLGGSRKTNIEWGFPEKGGGGLDSLQI